jgi:hypothetical protein
VVKQDKGIFYVLWFISPFLSVIYLFKKSKLNNSIGPYLLLSVFFGLSFVVSTSGADSARYAEELVRFHQNNMSFAELRDSLYSEESNKLDIYQPLVTWLVSLFTDNVKFLFAIFAFVFGYFWFKSLLLIRSYLSIPLTGLALVVFIFLALANPIWSINGVRMWTAIMIFFYGLLLLNLQNNKKGWYFLVLPILVHFSLLIGLVLYFLYRVLPVKNKNLHFGLFIATFLIGEVSLELVRSYFEQLPQLVQSKDSYLNQDYADGLQESKQQLSPHVVLAGKLAKYNLLVIVGLMYFFQNRKKINLNKNFDLFFKMGLFFASFTNIAASVPSGGRFVVLSNLILYTAFLFFLNEKIKIPILIKSVLTLSLLLVIVFKIRVGLDYIGIFLFIGNPIINWFVVDTPIIDFIKLIF